MVLTHSSLVLNRISKSLQETFTGECRQLGFHAMGAWCQLLFVEPSREAGDFFIQETVRFVADFEARYSRFLPDSLISTINAAAGQGWVEIDPETELLLGLCQDLHQFTQGAFDPTSLALLRLWDWNVEPRCVPDASAIRAALEMTGWDKVQRKDGALFLPRAGMGIDLGAIGKEYAVDRVIQLAQEHGIANVLVDFGQDLRVQGLPPAKPAWHIGLEDPKQPGRCWTGLAIRDKAVATAGDYLRHFVCDGRRYGHILDPRTGYPVDNGCLAVSVIASTCTIAGVLATTAFILGAEKGLKLIESYPDAAGCITTHQSREQTKDFCNYLTE